MRNPNKNSIKITTKTIITEISADHTEGETEREIKGEIEETRSV